jgi:hypothetical protein
MKSYEASSTIRAKFAEGLKRRAEGSAATVGSTGGSAG